MSQTNETRNPEVVKQEVDETQNRLAESVEHVAYHKAHLKEEVKEAAKDQVVEAKDSLKQNVSDKAHQIKDSLTGKRASSKRR